MGNKFSNDKKKKKNEIKEEEKDTYKYLENYEVYKDDVTDSSIDDKDLIGVKQNYDFSLKNLEIVTKFDIEGDSLDTLILNDGRIARIIDNSLIIYNKNNFKIQINIKAEEEIYNIYQLKNNKLIVIFEHFLMIYKLKKDKIFLLQKIEFFGFAYDKYYIIKDFSKSHIKASFSPEILEISNKSFIIKFLIKRKTTDKDPYAEYHSPELYIRVYEYDKNTKGIFLKEVCRQVMEQFQEY